MTKGKYHLHFQSRQYRPSCRRVVSSCFSSCSALGRSARSSKTCVSLCFIGLPHPRVSGRRKVPRGFLCLPLQNKKVILAYYQPYPGVPSAKDKITAQIFLLYRVPLTEADCLDELATLSQLFVFCVLSKVGQHGVGESMGRIEINSVNKSTYHFLSNMTWTE